MQNQIPENWQKVKLGNVLGHKGYIRGPFGSSLRRGELLTEGIPVYEQQNAIRDNRNFRFYINEKKFNELRRFAVQPNDLVISCSGSLGKVTIIRENDPEGIISQALLILRPEIHQILPKYLYYFLTSSAGFRAMISRSTGSALVNIAKREIIEGIELSTPPIPIQKVVVEILSAFDDKIKVNNKSVKTLEETANLLFKEWFLNNQGKEYSLLDIADFINGGAFGRIVNKNKKGLPLIKIAELNRGITENSEWVDKDVASKYLIKDGVLLFSWSGSVGVYIWDKGPGVLNQHIFNVIPKNNFSLGFLYFLLMAKVRIFQHTAGAKATTMGHIKKEHLRDETIFIPADRDLNLFDVFYKQIINLKLENQKLATLRDLLLPKLMRGEIRV